MTQQEFQTRYKYNPSTDCIGEGGFGKVYKAYDTHLDKWVAIKVAEVKPGLEQVRLKKEVEIVSKLPTHPNIANYEACYTFSSFTGEYDFAVLQYYEEGNLQQLIDSRKLNQTQKETLLRQILEGVGFLHNQGIIHRDLKPQNILIAKRNDEYIPKITDFGISKKLDINKSSVFTNSLAGAGTMAYASPEQLLGKTIKKNTDLWSFGVIAFQLLTGKMPFNTGKETLTSEAGRQELYKQITSGVISDNLSSISETWKNLILNCLVVDNNLRMQNVNIHRNATENHLKLETNNYTHKATHDNNTTRIENRNTTVVESTEPQKSTNNQSNNSSNFKVIISVIALFILIIVGFKYYNQNTDNVNGDLQPPNEDSVAVDTVAIVDTVAVDTTAIINTNSSDYNNRNQINYRFRPAKSIIYGYLSEEIVAGPPGWGETPELDNRTVYFVNFYKSINVIADVGSEDEINVTTYDIRKVHLSNFWDYENFKNKKVKLTGDFWGAHTGHHYTPVCFTVESIEIVN
jgi:serine/threonine protein kinase